MRALSDQRAITQLHTDILRQLYSDVTVRIKSQTGDVRKVHLVDKLGISRTYAVTHFYPQNWTSDVKHIAEVIKRGEGIGEAFRRRGYDILKTPLCTMQVGLSSHLQQSFAASRASGVLHQYNFVVSKAGSPPLCFATITEIYPPDVSDVLQRERLLYFTDDMPLHCLEDLGVDVVLPVASTESEV